jgi:hypothetical protein
MTKNVDTLILQTRTLCSSPHMIGDDLRREGGPVRLTQHAITPKVTMFPQHRHQAHRHRHVPQPPTFRRRSARERKSVNW